MVSSVQKAFPACVRSVKRGDIYYADFGPVEDAVGHELAKKRPVLIIQNNIGNKKSTTTICLCLSTKCKYGVPYHVRFNDFNIVNRESDICAEQIKTIDQCRLEEYLGNVGSAVMEQVERKALVKEVACLESMLAYVDTEKMVQAFKESIKLSDEKIREANKITFVKELMEEVVG